MARDDRQDDSSTHDRPPFADPLADGMDPTAPGAPHEPGGSDYHQSETRTADTPDRVQPDRDQHRAPPPDERET